MPDDDISRLYFLLCWRAKQVPFQLWTLQCYNASSVWAESKLPAELFHAVTAFLFYQVNVSIDIIPISAVIIFLCFPSFIYFTTMSLCLSNDTLSSTLDVLTSNRGLLWNIIWHDGEESGLRTFQAFACRHGIKVQITCQVPSLQRIILYGSSRTWVALLLTQHLFMYSYVHIFRMLDADKTAVSRV